MISEADITTLRPGVIISWHRDMTSPFKITEITDKGVGLDDLKGKIWPPEQWDLNEATKMVFTEEPEPEPPEVTTEQVHSAIDELKEMCQTSHL